MNASASPAAVLISGGRVLDLDGDVHHPPVRDLLVVGERIAACRPGIAADLAAGRGVPELPPRAALERVSAKDKLVIPGFVNAHYHSHDVLLKGCFETIPLELWVLSALPPAFPKRSSAEIRARTLLGAVECLRSGITTVQDLATVYPYDEAHVDAILQAYEDVGIRCVFALQVADVPGVKSIPFWDEVVPASMQKGLSGAVEPLGRGAEVVELVKGAIARREPVHPRVTWALGPTSPERCSEALLGGFGDLSRGRGLPIYTHIYESKAMTLMARHGHRRDEGSLIRYLERCGILSPKLSLAHSVWMLPEEIRMLADAGANVVLNPVGNLKTKSGVAPIRPYLEAGVPLALGCDNCSCSDAQNMFQSMKLFTALAAVTHPEPGPPTARDALAAATLAGARTAGLESDLGALKPGLKADLAILDLTDPSFVPLNSVARQLVFTEAGRSVEHVMVDGRFVLRDRRITSIDEAALREEVAELMVALRRDLDVVLQRNERMLPYLLEAHRRVWQSDIGLNRYIGAGNG
ncbi:MAG TPA: amidohydrolase family protein [Burkholderiales bacterium]|nr:amidohydrolase family protein [Burkholderiales bacterium]